MVKQHSRYLTFEVPRLLQVLLTDCFSYGSVKIITEKKRKIS